MSGIEQAVATTGEAWSKLDVAAIRRRIEEFAELHSELESARLRTARDITEIDDRIHNRRDGPNPESAADAILNGKDVLTAEPSVDQLIAEKEALLAARTGIKRRQEAVREELNGHLRCIAAAVAEGASPLIDELKHEASEAISRLAQVYASVSALHGSVRSGPLTRLRDKLYPVIEAGRQFAGSKAGDVPDEVSKLLEGASPMLELQQARITRAPLRH